MSQNFKVKNGLDVNGVQIIAANGSLTGPALTQITNVISSSSDTWVRDAANAASSYANSGYSQANTATTNAATADQRAVTSGDYANSAFSVANTALSSIPSLSGYATESYVGTAISNLVDSAPSTLDTLNELAAALGDDANFSTTLSNMVGVSGGYANSAYSAANTADQRAVTSGVYANSAYSAANTAQAALSSAGNNAIAAYSQANTATTNAATADQKAVSAGSYANSAYSAANTAVGSGLASYNHAAAAFGTANTAVSSGLATYNHAVAAFGTANNAYTSAGIAVSGNAISFGHANAAFNTANSSISAGVGTYNHAAAAFNLANNSVQQSGHAALESLGVGASAPGTTGAIRGLSLGIGTAASGTTGEIRATNNITAYYSSDKKFKENVQDVTDALDIVCAIGSKTFDWTDAYLEAHGGQDDYFLRKSDFGVIAQDVQAVFPQAVRTREDGTLAVDYEKLAVLSFGAIKELVKRIEALEGK